MHSCYFQGKFNSEMSRVNKGLQKETWKSWASAAHFLSHYKRSFIYNFFFDSQHSHLPGNVTFPKLPEIRHEQMTSRAVTFMLLSVCGWRIAWDNVPLWGAEGGLWRPCHSCKRMRTWVAIKYMSRGRHRVWHTGLMCIYATMISLSKRFMRITREWRWAT